ncbi:MAG: 50S ribosomal protein L1 [Chloroflexi bacterium]|nr:50S ribosomal protein L1 [Chloroflexota bacterium]
MAKQGKKYIEAAKLIDRSKEYEPKEAIALTKKAAYAKFDETVEMHLWMGLDQKKADQQVRGVALLPNGLGKKTRILVFAQGEAARIAQEAGADHVGGDELVKKIEEGWLDFDVAIATPDIMSRIARLGRILGKRGLMPNPKSGTVVAPDVLASAIKDARKGRVEFRLDKTSVIHVPVGKVSFEGEKLLENVTALADALVRAKPAGAKGQYIKSAYVCSTHGPSVKVDVSFLLSMKTE